MNQVKSILRVPYGLRDGKMWAARDVPTGLACRCLCIGCDQPLVAKNHGKKVRPHFAHHVDRACQGAFESSIHRRAKELIVDKGMLMLPAWDGSEGMPNPPVASDDDGRMHLGRHVDVPANMVALMDAKPEIQRGDYRPDVVAKDPDGELLIEIRVTHAVGDQKIRNVQSDGQRMLEIDLSRITADQAEDPDLFEHLVLTTASNRIWISHPTATDAWRRARDELKETIRAKNKSIAAALAHRRKLKEETDAQRQILEARKAQYRSECRQPHLEDLASLKEKTSNRAISEKYRCLLERDRSSANAATNCITAEAAKPFLGIVPALGWVYDAHPHLWQAGAFVRFIEGKPPGHAFEQPALGRWVRATYGRDELLWSLFRAQWVARCDALKRGRRMRIPWAWFFSPEENKRIPNFFEPIDEFIGNMLRCGVLTRDRNRPRRLTVCAQQTTRPAPTLTLPRPSKAVPPPLNDHKTSLMAVPVVTLPPMRTPDPLLGKVNSHEGLGIGVVTERVMRCSPVYDVRFEDDSCQRILLRSGHRDWRLVEEPTAEPLAAQPATVTR